MAPKSSWPTSTTPRTWCCLPSGATSICGRSCPSSTRWMSPRTRPCGTSDGLVQKPYRVRTDANGFMLPYNHYDKPDLTLVFLGGSTIACIYVDEDEPLSLPGGPAPGAEDRQKDHLDQFRRRRQQLPAFPGYSAEQDYPAQARRRGHDAQYQRPGGPDLRQDLLEQKSHPAAHRRFLFL